MSFDLSIAGSATAVDRRSGFPHSLAAPHAAHLLEARGADLLSLLLGRIPGKVAPDSAPGSAAALCKLDPAGLPRDLDHTKVGWDDTMPLGNRNVVLIGMPGVGKTTIGKLLARLLGRSFVDTDRVIEQREGRPLREILADKGIAGFRHLEEDCVAALDCRESVIATGGSVVYGERAMRSLRAQGIVVHLDLPVEILERRVGDIAERAVLCEPGQTLASLYAERQPLYARWADVVVPVAGLDHDETVRRVAESLGANEPRA